MLVAFGGVLAALGLYLAFVIRIRRQTLRVVRRRGRVPASSASPFQIRSGEFPGTISIADYFHSLQLLGGSLSLQSLLTAVLERYGLSLALPFALLIPADLLPLDNRYLVKPKALAESLMSSVCLGGICVMAKEIGRHAHFELTADGENHQGEPHSAVDKMERGSGDARVLEVLGRQENVIEMDAVEMLVEKIKMKYGLDPRGVPREISPASLPGLRFGNTGLPYLFEVDQERKNEVMSTICNRLCGNVLLHEPGVSDSAFVAVVAGCRATTLEDFIELLEKTGHRVSMEIRTNITSMGIGLSVLDRHDPTTEALNVPMCFPIRTNIVVPVPKTGNAGSREFQRHTELVSLMTHAAVFVEIAGPIIQYAKLEWCLNVNGMTGFQGVSGVARPWQTDPGSYVVHTPHLFSSRKKRARAARLMSIISAVTNAQADTDRIVLGGYGYFGVCCDSVALLQTTLGEKRGTTIYPLLLGGGAKTCLMNAYQEFARTHASYKKDAMRLRDSLQHLPCDIVVDDPRSCARRCLSSLPTKSIFTAVDTIRERLQQILHCD